MPTLQAPIPDRPYATITPDGEHGLKALSVEWIHDQYRRHGALLLRGFDADLDAFRHLARSVCATAVINETPGRQMLDPRWRIQSVDGGKDAFALHPELSREPFKPDVALFCCLNAPRRGGATTLCDGIRLAAALPEPVRRGLEGRRLIYLMGVWPEFLNFWLGSPDPSDSLLADPPTRCPYRFRRLPDGRIVRLFSRPALHHPMFSDALAFGNFLLFARFQNGRRDFPLLNDFSAVPEEWLQAIRVCAERLTVDIQWRNGDVLVLDNTRFMHGRRAIENQTERSIATFFGYLDGAKRDPEEPPNPIWRQRDFAAPPHPDLLDRGEADHNA